MPPLLLQLHPWSGTAQLHPALTWTGRVDITATQVSLGSSKRELTADMIMSLVSQLTNNIYVQHSDQLS